MFTLYFDSNWSENHIYQKKTKTSLDLVALLLNSHAFVCLFGKINGFKLQTHFVFFFQLKSLTIVASITAIITMFITSDGLEEERMNK